MTDPANPTTTLKRPVDQATIRASFGHGRPKQAVVEKVKRRDDAACDATTVKEAGADDAVTKPSGDPEMTVLGGPAHREMPD